MDSHHSDRGPVFLIWALVIVVFVGLAITEPANLVPLALVLVAYIAIARWMAPEPQDQAERLPDTVVTQPQSTNQNTSKASRAA